MSPIFNYFKEDIREKVGKSSKTVGFRHKGNYAGEIGLGIHDKITRVEVGSSVVWEGTITFTNIVPKWLTVPQLGQVRFYSGRPSQGNELGQVGPDRIFDGVANPTSYRNICYAVFEKVDLTDGGSPQNVRFLVERTPKVLKLDPANATTDPDNDDVSYHNVNGDVLLPEMIWDLETNPLYGLRRDTSELNEASFIAAANADRTAGFAVSEIIEDSKSISELLEEYIKYRNIYLRPGPNGLEYTQKGDKTIVNLAAGTASTRLEVKPQAADQVPNRCWFTYNYETRNFDPTPIPYYAETFDGRVRKKQIHFRGITQKAIAEKSAAIVGARITTPRMQLPAFALPWEHRTLRPGDEITPALDTSLTGETDFEVESVKINLAGNREVTVTATQSTTTIEDNSQPVDSTQPDSGFTVSASDPVFRICKANTDQIGPAKDAAVLCFARTDETTSGYLLEVSADNSTWQTIFTRPELAHHATIIGWKDVDSENIVVDVRFANQVAHDAFVELTNVDHPPETLAVTGIYDRSSSGTVNKFRIEPAWMTIRFDSPIENTANFDWRLRLRCGIYDSPCFASEDGTDGVFPSTVIYFGSEREFPVYRTNKFRVYTDEANGVDDTALKRYIRARHSYLEIEAGSDFPAQVLDDDGVTVTFDRDDTTETPSGSYASGSDWGSYAPNDQTLGDSGNAEDNQAPTVSTQPLTQKVASGSTTTLFVSVNGTPAFTYQWYEGASGVTTSPVSGATSASFTTPAITAAKDYWVRITNSTSSVDSNTASITLATASSSSSSSTQLGWDVVTGLQFAIEATNRTDVTGDKVSALKDVSQASKPELFTQSTDSKRPTLIANAQGTHPAIQFNGSSQYLVASGEGIFSGAAANDHFLLALRFRNLSNISGTSYLFGFNVSGVTNTFGFDISTATYSFAEYSQSGQSVYAPSGNSVINGINQTLIIEGKFSSGTDSYLRYKIDLGDWVDAGPSGVPATAFGLSRPGSSEDDSLGGRSDGISFANFNLLRMAGYYRTARYSSYEIQRVYEKTTIF